ncbi:flagellar basal body rod protein FlgC [Pseudobacteroides cellulosolvens]|uniref:Flagellar basal-body rod protein FlgC n=1 Tax=Pseudobacteroides cellulosolvens ATCC 35603 = DSM 2933 TaxID=398512 RepID=A0A0L6JRB3_9FIRM|nr:flagellar basal body rod protein FlgC [Pseudobacteroides cellulosolvens]KNY28386.1 flagellar basal-body rod protein FlgC [Pseudobacteroides cellulosolvens ATCC 35603 = DSM 2933]
MGYFSSLDISSTGLTAQRLRMDIISQNIANAETTRNENGQPYRRKLVVFEEKSTKAPFSEYLNTGSKDKIAGNGVRVSNIVEDPSPLKKIYNPGHPDADKDGYVSMPNVDVLTEMINMISATRSYEANVTAINTTKSMAMKALDIGR